MSDFPACPKCHNAPAPGGRTYSIGSICYAACCGLTCAVRYCGPPAVAAWFNDQQLGAVNSLMNSVDAWRKEAWAGEWDAACKHHTWTLDSSCPIPAPPTGLLAEIKFGNLWVRLKAGL